MAVFQKRAFGINLGFVAIGGVLSEDDRQCAWELYTEIVTRVAVRGKVDSKGEDVFAGELFVESLDSMYGFFQAAREIMKRFPVGRLVRNKKSHLGTFIQSMLEVVVRPFLEKWQAVYRHWWAHQGDEGGNPFRRQDKFPLLDEMKQDWVCVRRFCRETATDLAKKYNLVDVQELVEPAVREQWQSEIEKIIDHI